MPDELVVNIPPTQEISLDQENVDPQPSTSNQNPRRKRQRSRRYAAEDGDHAALEAAQSRLEAIEARNAEATLKHAEATLQHAEAVNNLAAAITQQTSTTAKMVDLLDRFMTSVSKKPTVTIPLVDASPTSVNLENNSFSLLENYEVPVVMPDELVVNIPPTQEISLDQENVDPQPSTSNQNPRRKRQRSRRYAAEDGDHAALEAAQSRLEAIEARNAEATLKHAEATLQHAEAVNNLAAAITQQTSTTAKMVDLLDRFMTSVSKKPTVTIPLVDASPTSVNLENNSFSLLENYEVPVVMPDELVVNIPPTQEISLDQENVDPQPSTSNQNPRRKRQRSRRYAAEDGDHAALEAAQSRLEAIEARNAEATLKHAEATLQHAEAVNNLAAAITQQTSTTAKMVDLLDRFMTSVSKKPTVTIPLVDASPTSVNLENNSFSLLENYEVPVVMPDELVVNIPPTQEISLDQENVDPQPSTSNQNPRRKRQRSRRYAAEDGDHAALEAAQSRLEAIEARNAEATLKHAEATLQHAEAVNNLAAAITQQTSTTAKMVDLLDRFMTSVSKKKFRRILLSSDSESD
ncbi:hypothetical protein PYW08_008958 [Mythimna loreyi]|uniref:Uncharacterized protein n=1 Tax=Mythimna loreyi TaxID=667449 RepID=A0ACC2QB44_9NEOP|nr:hypothetical protein PYW08_008958 [Mythimna loreyi]